MNIVPESARHLQMTRTRILCMDTPDFPEAKIRVDKLIIGRMRQYEEGWGMELGSNLLELEKF